MSNEAQDKWKNSTYGKKQQKTNEINLNPIQTMKLQNFKDFILLSLKRKFLGQNYPLSWLKQWSLTEWTCEVRKNS